MPAFAAYPPTKPIFFRQKGAEIFFMESSSEIASDAIKHSRFNLSNWAVHIMIQCCALPGIATHYFSALFCSRCAFEAHMEVNLGLSQLITFRSSLP